MEKLSSLLPAFCYRRWKDFAGLRKSHPLYVPYRYLVMAGIFTSRNRDTRSFGCSKNAVSRYRFHHHPPARRARSSIFESKFIKFIKFRKAFCHVKCPRTNLTHFVISFDFFIAKYAAYFKSILSIFI